MRKRMMNIFIVLCILSLIVYGVWHYTRPKPLDVAVKAVTLGMVERTVANTRAGTIKACRRAKLSPSIGGQIANLPIKAGDTVRKGQLLLELWNKDLVAQVTFAEQETVAARYRAGSVCSRADIARRNADRFSELSRMNIGTQERTDNAEAEANALQDECEGAKVEVAVRGAQLEAARAGLERTRLTAPFDGVVAEINGELFEYVTPSPLGVATPPAVDIIGSNCFYVIAPIDEVDAADIRVNMPARISMDAFGERRFDGRVRRIADYVLDVEKQARTVDVEVSFNNPQDIRNLLAGYSADIEVILDVRKDVVRVPTEAVMDGRRVYVFLAAEKTIAMREIRIGLSNWDWTEVVEGLSP
ncbi:efflux RND transporter periplasmic adaptor subunit, partial [Desulfosarcina sp.]|uniref:efflux RND transporter periplasmic adaptor subunit n=1 Tax=Desulfosarcina sp. TaxID=2027861 RepID=UPI003971122F